MLVCDDYVIQYKPIYPVTDSAASPVVSFLGMAWDDLMHPDTPAYP